MKACVYYVSNQTPLQVPKPLQSGDPFALNLCKWWLIWASLLAFTANSAAQSSAQTHIHSAIVVIDTSNSAWHSQVHWLFGTAYLVVKASNVEQTLISRVGMNFFMSPPISIDFIRNLKSPYSEIGDSSFSCALWTFKQQLTWKVRARCGISIVLL